MIAATVASFMIAQAFGLPEGYWSVLSAIVVMQSSLGATLGASLDRLLGTIAGAAAGVVWVLVREHLVIPQVLILTLAIAPMALLASIRPSFRIAPMTTVIVLLAAPPGGGALIALHRLAEISLGCGVGALTAHFVLPDRTRGMIDASASAALEGLGRLADALLRREPDLVVESLLVALRRHLGAIGAADQDARWERALRLRTGPVAAPMLRSIRRLRSDVAMVGRAMAADPAMQAGAVASALAAHFSAAAAYLRGGAADPGFDALDEAIGSVPQNTMLAFALTTLRRDLTDLAERLGERRNAEGME